MTVTGGREQRNAGSNWPQPDSCAGWHVTSLLSGVHACSEIADLSQTVALVEELLSQLPDATAAAQFTIVCADVDTADLASQRLRNAVAVLDPQDSGLTGGPLLIVSPRPDQVWRFDRFEMAPHCSQGVLGSAICKQ